MTTAWGKEDHRKIIKLFFCIPIYHFKQTADKKLWKICGVPFFKIRRKNDGAVMKYYFCGIRFLTAKIKQG